MRSFYSIVLISAAVLVLQSCAKQDVEVVKQPEITASSKVATDWMYALRQVVQSEAKSPPQASRIYAYTGIGLYEAVLPGMPGYRSLQGQIPGLNNLPQVNMYTRLDYTTAANEALFQISMKIFGALKPENIQVIERLHAAYLKDAASKVAVDVFEESNAFGKKVADAVMDRANNDNFAATRNLTYSIPAASINPSYWSPTGSALSPLEPYWGKLKCFTMANGGACTVPSAIPFSITPGSAFYEQAKEVLVATQNLTEDHKAIARWWSDGTAQTATPPGHWVAIADQIAMQKNLNLGKAAEMYAMLNIAMADAFISCWDEKFKLNLLRPVTYIRKYIPGNSTYEPLLGTPPFPEYPSGHSVASSAAGRVLTQLFGDVAFTDTANVYLGYAPRSYTSFNQAADEAAISRLYGGIHFREAIENGLAQGREVSRVVFEKIKLRR